MGLKKAIELPSGVTVDYWRILRAQWSIECDTCEVTLGGYLNQESRDADKAAVIETTIPMTKVETLLKGKDSFVELYGKIKTHPDFSGSVDA